MSENGDEDGGEDSKTDWAKVGIHSVCGFLIGLPGAWVWTSDFKLILIIATITGALAGAFGDSFWTWFIKWRNWL